MQIININSLLCNWFDGNFILVVGVSKMNL